MAFVPKRAHEFVDEIARRTRDPHATATTRPQLLELLTHAYRTVAHSSASVVVTQQIELEPQRCLYDLDAISHQLFPAKDEAIARLVAVRYDGRDLVREDWQALAKISPTWLREFATSPTVWAAIGRNIVAIWPGPLDLRIPVDLVFVPAFKALTEDDEITLPESEIIQLLDLAEGLVFLRRRLFNLAKTSFGRGTRGQG